MWVAALLLLSLFSHGYAYLKGSPDIRSFHPRPPVCPDSFSGYLPAPDSCTSFYECRGGVATRRECPRGMLYNAISPYARSPCNYYSYSDECESLISASVSFLQGKAIPRFCLSLFSWSIMYLHTRLILYLFEK